MIHGWVEPGFEEVEAEFRKNFAERGELGAACAIYYQGHEVVDMWGGYRDEKTMAPWEQDTLVGVFSTTKGIAALAMALAHSQGLFEWDEKVATYWPEFAQAGKEHITVRQLLDHKAGLCAIDESLDLETLADLDRLAEIIARQKPAWEPGTRWGYHCWDLGFYQNELIRRVDPQGRSIGQFSQDELAGPLGAEFYIGLPEDVPDSRVADFKTFSLLRLFTKIDQIPIRFTLSLVNPKSLSARTTLNPKVMSNHANFNRRDVRSVELASGNGIGQARAIAHMYGTFAIGGGPLNLKPETLDALTAPATPPTSGSKDVVWKMDMSYSLGFFKPGPGFRFGSSGRAFGIPGAGGSFGYADPDAGVGFGYTPNKMDVYFSDEPRHKALRDALHTCIKKVG
jgi:CubicO group peptidase (beta-lactamase class C family)